MTAVRASREKGPKIKKASQELRGGRGATLQTTRHAQIVATELCPWGEDAVLSHPGRARGEGRERPPPESQKPPLAGSHLSLYPALTVGAAAHICASASPGTSSRVARYSRAMAQWSDARPAGDCIRFCPPPQSVKLGHTRRGSAAGRAGVTPGVAGVGRGGRGWRGGRSGRAGSEGCGKGSRGLRGFSVVQTIHQKGVGRERSFYLSAEPHRAHARVSASPSRPDTHHTPCLATRASHPSPAAGLGRARPPARPRPGGANGRRLPALGRDLDLRPARLTPSRPPWPPTGPPSPICGPSWAPSSA